MSDQPTGCGCAMCNHNPAGRIARTSYIRAGIVVSEKRHTGEDRRKDRKLRRMREKRIWGQEIAAI